MAPYDMARNIYQTLLHGGHAVAGRQAHGVRACHQGCGRGALHREGQGRVVQVETCCTRDETRVKRAWLQRCFLCQRSSNPKALTWCALLATKML